MSDDECYPRRSVTAADLKGILMAARISPKAAPGSLLKGERKPAKRDKRPVYLAQIRELPCLSCDTDPAGEAAHLRLSAPGKPNALGQKPDDAFALPLCAQCHRRQHAGGEAEFWRDLGLDPIRIALKLYSQRIDLEDMRATVFAAREKRK